MQSYTDYTIKRTKALNILPPSSNLRRSGVFRTDYNCVEKTLLPLIIKHWDSIWVTKYVLIKVACHFLCTFLTCISPYMAACTSFWYEKIRKWCPIKMVGSILNLRCLTFEYKIWALKCSTFQKHKEVYLDVYHKRSNYLYNKLMWLKYEKTCLYAKFIYINFMGRINASVQSVMIGANFFLLY